VQPVLRRVVVQRVAVQLVRRVAVRRVAAQLVQLGARRLPLAVMRSLRGARPSPPAVMRSPPVAM
jgi:hypothetical protein